MLGALLLAFVTGIVGTFVLNWVTWLLPDFLSELLGDYLDFLGAFTSLAIGYVAGMKANLLTSVRHIKVFTFLVAVIALCCLVCWYYFNYYFHFRPDVIAAITQENANPEQILDQLLLQETGYKGFLGYLILSAGNGFTGWLNWGIRLFVLFISIVWARYGLRIALTERIQPGQASSDILAMELNKMLFDD
ncbi:MAG: hypothetical protein H6632_00775 [Anaerolineales bacterium]|nr:hypothetical protein [Anaerolineales bacterium]